MKATKASALSPKWDFLGIGLSIACGIHCLAAPLLLSALPIMGMEFLAGEGVETAMIVIITVLVGYAGYRGFKLHENLLVVVLFLSGLLAFLLLRPLVSEVFEPMVTVTGGLLIISGHTLNWLASKPCQDCSEAD